MSVIENKPVGIISVGRFPHPYVKNLYKVMRLVILPEYQGIGLGVKLLEYICALYRNAKKRINITTSNPALIHHFVKNSNWKLILKGFQRRHRGLKHMKVNKRFITTWERLDFKKQVEN